MHITKEILLTLCRRHDNNYLHPTYFHIKYIIFEYHSMNHCHNLMIFAQKDEFNLASILQYKIRFDASDFVMA